MKINLIRINKIQKINNSKKIKVNQILRIETIKKKKDFIHQK